MKANIKRLLAAVMAVFMLVGMVPFGVFAKTEFTNSQLKIVTDK